MHHLIEHHFAPHGYAGPEVLERYAVIQAENQAGLRATGRWWYIADRLAILSDRLGSSSRVSPDALTSAFKSFVHGNLVFLPGAMDAIHAARRGGRRVGMLTNGPSHVQRPKIESAKLEPHFDFIGVTGELGHWKPSPQAFAAVLEKLGVAAHQTLMVGDSLDFDIVPAKKLGWRTAWVDRDGRSHPDADIVVRNPGELARLL
jgi:HAD superfamily hydrolase (TIGR01509 family)